MKKVMLSTLLISSLLLSACQGEAVPSEEEANEQEDATTEVSSDADTSEEETDESTEEDEAEADAEAEEEVEDLAYQYQINPNIFSVEPIDPETAEDEKLVLLTFDDAPYGNSLQIADTLEERGVSAIFFVNSMYMEDEEGFAAIQELHDRGFEIANHTHTHAKLDDYSEDSQRDEIVTTSDIVEEATGERPRFFRAPHGVMTEYSKQVVAEENMTWMNWSFGYDWEVQYQDPAALADITLNTELLGDGANILMHDREWTADAVPEIVDGLIDQGFTIVDPKLIKHE